MSNFSENLKNQRIKHNLRQSDIAQKLNVSLRQYQRYESGQQQPTLENLFTLISLFDISFDELVGKKFYKLDSGKDKPDIIMTTDRNPRKAEIFYIYEGLSVSKRQKLLDYARFLRDK